MSARLAWVFMEVLRDGVSMTAAQLSCQALGCKARAVSQGQSGKVNEIEETTSAVAWWP